MVRVRSVLGIMVRALLRLLRRVEVRVRVARLVPRVKSAEPSRRKRARHRITKLCSSKSTPLTARGPQHQRTVLESHENGILTTVAIEYSDEVARECGSGILGELDLSPIAGRPLSPIASPLLEEDEEGCEDD